MYTRNGPRRPNEHASDNRQAGIWITPDEIVLPLHPTARVNYARVFNIEHGLRVKSYGRMDDHSLSILLRQWKQVCIQMYRPDPGAFAKAVHEPSPQSLGNLDFTPTQVTAILEVIKDGTEPRLAIAKIARNNAAGQLGSQALADMVSDSMSEGLGYSAAVSRVRHRVVRTVSSGGDDSEQAHEGAKYDDLDVDDEIGADDDPGLEAGQRFGSIRLRSLSRHQASV